MECQTEASWGAGPFGKILKRMAAKVSQTRWTEVKIVMNFAPPELNP
jgi:hypothetical protein